MPIVAKTLTAKAVRELREPGRYPVGTVPGLMLWVSPTGARSWVLRTMVGKVGKKRKDIGLGGYPGVSLADAISQARDTKMAIKAGVDPVKKKREERSANERTFRKVAEKYIALKRGEWKNIKHGKQWTSTLEKYAYPTIGDMPVSEIQMSDIKALLEKHWSTKTETMARVRSRIKIVLDSAAVQGFRDKENPAQWGGNLSVDLSSPRKLKKLKPKELRHHKALPYKDAPDFMKALNQAEGTSAKALKFTILTAARSGEVRNATWSEIDLDAGMWELPEIRMKSGREHRVPLSHAAVTLLNAMPRFKDCDLVFPGRSLKALSDMSLLAVMRRMEIDAVPHGFRSSFRNWAAEATAYPSEVCEMALAHSLGDETKEAYLRSDLFEKRAKLMEDWAAYLGEPAPKREESTTDNLTERENP